MLLRDRTGTGSLSLLKEHNLLAGRNTTLTEIHGATAPYIRESCLRIFRLLSPQKGKHNSICFLSGPNEGCWFEYFEDKMKVFLTQVFYLCFV